MIYKKIDDKSTQVVKDNSIYLDRKLKNSKNALILHNVTIEHKEERVTIDHIIISRMGIEVLKSKGFGDREILIGGDNSLIIDNRHYSNPLEKIKEERRVLEGFLEENFTSFFNKYWFIDSKIKIDVTVVFELNSHIVNEKLPKGFDRIENYLFHREEKISKIKRLDAFKILANMLNAKNIKDIASLLSQESMENTTHNGITEREEELLAS